MAQPGQPDNDDAQFRDDIDEILGHANPNPDRIGCPPRDVLIGLARRQRSLGDPGYEHLLKCSPCYREFRAMQEQAKTERGAAHVSSTRRWAWLATAAALLAILAAVVWFTRGERGSGTPQVASSTATPEGVNAEVDLRPFVVMRSEQGSADAPPVSLPAGVVDLTLLLPVGSEPGAYDVQLLDGDLRLRSEATGTGAIEDFVTTVRVRLDLQRLAPGRYQLAVRRQGDSWRMFPAEVR